MIGYLVALLALVSGGITVFARVRSSSGVALGTTLLSLAGLAWMLSFPLVAGVWAIFGLVIVLISLADGQGEATRPPEPTPAWRGPGALWLVLAIMVWLALVSALRGSLLYDPIPKAVPVNQLHNTLGLLAGVDGMGWYIGTVCASLALLAAALGARCHEDAR